MFAVPKNWKRKELKEVVPKVQMYFDLGPAAPVFFCYTEYAGTCTKANKKLLSDSGVTLRVCESEKLAEPLRSMVHWNFHCHSG